MQIENPLSEHYSKREWEMLEFVFALFREARAGKKLRDRLESYSGLGAAPLLRHVPALLSAYDNDTKV